MKAAEQDIELLLLRFTKLVQLGAELSFATFKRVWVDLHFSYIFLVCCQCLWLSVRQYAQCHASWSNFWRYVV